MSEKDAAKQVEEFQRDISALREEIGKRIVGQRDIVDGVLICLLAGGHALLEGVPGLGKTSLVHTVADALGLRFSRVQFTPDLMPSDILGTTVIHEDEAGKKEFRFREGPIFANIVLADEINRATPKTQSALLEVMQEQAVTLANTTHKLQPPFFVLATQNPLEMEGTYPLPEAQLDRFLLKLEVTFPTHDELHAILDRTTGNAKQAVAKSMTRERLIEFQGLTRNVAVARHVQDYVIRILEATHPTHATAPDSVKRFVRYGASPRGAQACLLAAKVTAVMSGRFAVAPDDILKVVKLALRHRIVLSFEGEAEGIKTDRVINDIVERIQVAKA